VKHTGPKRLDERVGYKRLLKMSEKYSPREIAELLVDTGEIDEDIQFSSAVRAVKRAVKRIRKRKTEEVTLKDVEGVEFRELPEVKKFIEYQQAKNVQYKRLVRYLERMYEYVGKIRPILWERDEIIKILAGINTGKISKRCRPIVSYPWKQALRQFFFSQGKFMLTKDPLLSARRKDMRNPQGVEIRKDYWNLSEFREMLEKCKDEINGFEGCSAEDKQLILWAHFVLNAREGYNRKGGLLGLRWEYVHWDQLICDVYETKTGGGTLWENYPLDLFGSELPRLLKLRWKKLGRPKRGLIFDYFKSKHLLTLYRYVSDGKYRPRDANHSHATLCRSVLKVRSEAIIGQYNARTGKAKGIVGRGWEEADNYFSRYARLTHRETEEEQNRARINFVEAWTKCRSALNQ